MLWFMYILFIISAIVDWLWYTVSVTPFLIIPQLSDLNMMLQVRTSYEWTTFLTPTGIPSAAAETYAIKSVENYLTQLDLPDLDKTIVNTLSIIVLWDQLAILHLAKNSSNTALSQQPDSSSTIPTLTGLQKYICTSICQTFNCYSKHVSSTVPEILCWLECLHHYYWVTNTRQCSTPLKCLWPNCST